MEMCKFHSIFSCLSRLLSIVTVIFYNYTVDLNYLFWNNSWNGNMKKHKRNQLIILKSAIFDLRRTAKPNKSYIIMWISFLWPNGWEKKIEETLQRPTLGQFSIRRNNDEKKYKFFPFDSLLLVAFVFIERFFVLIHKSGTKQHSMPISITLDLYKQTNKNTYIFFLLLHKIKWEIKRKLSNTMLLFIKTLMERKRIYIIKENRNSHESLCVPGSFQLNNFSAHKTN